MRKFVPSNLNQQRVTVTLAITFDYFASNIKV